MKNEIKEIEMILEGFACEGYDYEAKRLGSYIKNLKKRIEELERDNQMLRLTVEKLTKQPYTYEVRGTFNENNKE